MMELSSTIKYMLIATALSIVLFFVCVAVIPVRPYIDVLGLAIAFFGGLTLIIYWQGERAQKTQQNKFFLYVVIVNVFVKLIGSFVFMFIYVKAKEPDDRYFLVPFLLTYLIFTIFETYILSEQARKSK